jgi:hypothetical protein
LSVRLRAVQVMPTTRMIQPQVIGPAGLMFAEANAIGWSYWIRRAVLAGAWDIDAICRNITRWPWPTDGRWWNGFGFVPTSVSI